MTVRIRFGARGGRTIAVRGALTEGKRERLLSRMHALAARDRAPITVDVSEMSYFDSDSLTMLFGTERIIERQLGCQVDICGLEAATWRVTGLTQDLVAS